MPAIAPEWEEPDGGPIASWTPAGARSRSRCPSSICGERRAQLPERGNSDIDDAKHAWTACGPTRSTSHKKAATSFRQSRREAGSVDTPRASARSLLEKLHARESAQMTARATFTYDSVRRPVEVLSHADAADRAASRLESPCVPSQISTPPRQRAHGRVPSGSEVERAAPNGSPSQSPGDLLTLGHASGSVATPHHSRTRTRVQVCEG